MLNVFIIIIAVVISSYLAFSKRLKTSSNWKATITPLASIMGSGFLVSAPLLGNAVGNFALLSMAVLLVLAYFVGSVMRFNIRYFEPISANKGSAQKTAFLSRIVLAGAYFISVTYYIQLLAAFALNAIGLQDETIANIIATGLLLVIGGVGIWRGLDQLEKVESYAVSVNLGMIIALLFALLVYNINLLSHGQWSLPVISSVIDVNDLRVLLGLLIVVQGFETSRYLGSQHSVGQRIATMRNAQLISSAIYLLFIGLCTVLFTQGLGSDVTAIITITSPVAIVLPILLTIAAMGSQFSAAVADNSGAGGLIEVITRQKIPMGIVYFLILLTTIILTWLTDVNAIIGYASRAFALFYMLQCIVAFLVAWQIHKTPKRLFRLAFFATITLICFLVFLLGLPAE